MKFRLYKHPHEINPLTAFSDRAAIYHNRPRYPRPLLTYLRDSCGLLENHLIADIGSGTGYLAELLLENGNRVFGVEPNASMRKIAETTLGKYDKFVSVEGRAEAIPLPDDSVDMVTIGQALHWFEIEEARGEFLRILKPGGWIVVVDNRACDEDSSLMKACRDLRKNYFRDIGTAADPPEKIIRLFDGAQFNRTIFPNPFCCSEQVFRDGFLSSSLAPGPGSQKFTEISHRLNQVFRRYQVNEKVTLMFETIVWSGSFK